MRRLEGAQRGGPAYNELVAQLTANFDDFNNAGHKNSSPRASKPAPVADVGNHFLGYTFRRKDEQARRAMSEGIFRAADATELD